MYSHDTALAVRDLSYVNPAKLHMTVPPGFRRNSETPAVLVLHKREVSPPEVIRERGYALTKPIRAILDCAEEGPDRDLLRQALEQGLRRGLITRQEHKEARSIMDLPGWLRKMLEKAA